MIPYIVNVAIILAGCLCFYKLFLQRETFYRLNRYVLVICLAISFCLPLLPVPQQWSFRKAVQTESSTVISTLEQKPGLPSAILQNENNPVAGNTVTVTKNTPTLFQRVGTWLIYLYWFGVGVFGLNFILQITVLLYRAYSRPVIRDGRYRIVEVAGDKAPCSFGNNIFINPEKYDWETYNQILLHEKEHIHQQHTLDIILSELVLIFQWFNPFAWIYRKELESNLEFLTDDQIVNQHRIDPSHYQMSLLKVSTPHKPLSVTTNYNQSLLKKRIVMMNAKKSNLHTTWKYFFLLPLLVLFVSLLNEPVAYGKSQDRVVKEKQHALKDNPMDTEGSWFATIKNEKVSIQFKSDEDERSYNSSTFKLSEFSSLPIDRTGSFRLKRDAGTMNFTGKFEGDQGMGRYEFVPDNNYRDYMKDEIADELDDRELLTFFFVNVSRGYVEMLQNHGYSKIRKDDLIPLAALGIDASFIRSLKQNGFQKVSLQDLIPLKSLNIDGDYIREIQNAGYPNVSVNQLITFKAQGIDGKYISDYKKASVNSNGRKMQEEDDDAENKDNHRKHTDEQDKNDKKHRAERNNDDSDLDDLVAMKALNVNADFIASWKNAGYSSIKNEYLIALKALGVTPDFAHAFQSVGYKNIPVDQLIPMKAQSITAEYIREFQNAGFRELTLDDVISMKALGITPEYGNQFHDLGYDNIPVSTLIPLKAQNITREFIKGFQNLGYTNLDLDEVIAAKAMNVTPEFIKSMKEKGHNYKSLEKYIQLKSILD